MNTVYQFCSEPPELGGSLICSCHGTNDIHTDKRVVTGKRTKRLGLRSNRRTRAIACAWSFAASARRISPASIGRKRGSYCTETLALMLDLVWPHSFSSVEEADSMAIYEETKGTASNQPATTSAGMLSRLNLYLTSLYRHGSPIVLPVYQRLGETG